MKVIYQTLIIGDYLLKRILNKPYSIPVELVKKSGFYTIKLFQWIINYHISTLEKIPDNLQTPLSLLSDNDNHPEEYTKEIIKKELPSLKIEESPFSSGSIAQCYYTTDKKYVIKIRHPITTQDYQLPKLLIKIIINYKLIHFPFDLEECFKKFENQLDFNEEAHHLHSYYRRYFDSKHIQIPRYIIHTKNILVMENVPSIPLYKCNLSQYKIQKILIKLLMFFRNSIMYHNLIHCDLHQSNWGLNGNKLVIYDFGFCTYSTPTLKKIFHLKEDNKNDELLKEILKCCTNNSEKLFNDIKKEAYEKNLLGDILVLQFDKLMPLVFYHLKKHNSIMDTSLFLSLFSYSLIEQLMIKYSIMETQENATHEQLYELKLSFLTFLEECNKGFTRLKKYEEQTLEKMDYF